MTAVPQYLYTSTTKQAPAWLVPPMSKGKTLSTELRYSTTRENTESQVTRLFYLLTDHVVADIASKALSPVVVLSEDY